MNLNIIKALVKKEFKQIIRDNSSILIAFVMPLVLLFLFGFGINFDTNTVKIGIVDNDCTTFTKDIIQSLNGTKYLDCTFYKTSKQADNALLDGKIRAYLTIPVNFTRELKKKISGNYAKPKIQIVTDGAEPNTAKYASSYIQGAILSFFEYKNAEGSIKTGKNGGIKTQIRSFYNPSLKSTYFILPSSLSIIITLTGTILTALVVAREWERGTMEALLTTEMSKADFVLSKYIAYFILGFLSVIFCLFFIIFIFKVPFYGSYIALFTVSAFFLLTGIGAGLFISTVLKDQFTSSQMAGTIGFMPSMMLSGLIYEIDSTPIFIRFLCFFIPARYYVSAVSSLFLSGVILKTVISTLIFMLIFSFLTGFLTFKATKERIEEC